MAQDTLDTRTPREQSQDTLDRWVETTGRPRICWTEQRRPWGKTQNMPDRVTQLSSKHPGSIPEELEEESRDGDTSA